MALEDKDKQLTAKEVIELQKNYMKKLMTNKVMLAGEVMSIKATDPKMKTNKDTGEPILDQLGNPTFWEAKYYLTLAFKGGESNVEIKKDWYDYLKVGDFILLEGSKQNKWGELVDVFHSYELL